MEFKCKCGHIIEDEPENSAISTKARLLAGDDFDAYSDRVDIEISQCLDAVMNNKVPQWMDQKFMEDYPKGLTPAQMLGDVLNMVYVGQSKDVFQCENCGRLWIEKDGENISFMPESGGSIGILGE